MPAILGGVQQSLGGAPVTPLLWREWLPGGWWLLVLLVAPSQRCGEGRKERPASPLICHSQEQLQTKTRGLGPTAVAKLGEKLSALGSDMLVLSPSQYL